MKVEKEIETRYYISMNGNCLLFVLLISAICVILLDLTIRVGGINSKPYLCYYLLKTSVLNISDILQY